MHAQIKSNDPDPVRRVTAPEVLAQIDKKTEENIRFYAAQLPGVIGRRIEELQREWSIERYLQLHMSTFGMITAVLALTTKRSWGILTCAALGFFLNHSLGGFDPRLPVLRRMSIRTRREIDREIFALRALRGDFNKAALPQPVVPSESVQSVLRAVGI